MISLWNQALARGLRRDGVLLAVSARQQALVVWQRGRVRARYAVSTSRQGLGCRTGSLKTPVGWHRILRWIGRGKPIGTIFKSRRALKRHVPDSEWTSEHGPEYILTRILRLQGLEKGLNLGPGVDSYRRFIYIHGTNQEHLLGQPASHGCIRMANRDLVRLFRRTEGHTTWCWIGP